MSVEPCQDFYQFACGNYIKETVIPDDKSSVALFNELNDKLEQQLRSSLESKISENEIRPFRLLRSLYNVCMNTSMLENFYLFLFVTIIAFNFNISNNYY